MIICMIGNPLSGKTTFALEVAREFNFGYLSTGEVARLHGISDRDRESIKRSDRAEDLEDAIRREVARVVSLGDVVLDGFPRSVEQMEYLLGIEEGWNLLVFFFYVNPVMQFSRMQGRKRDGDVLEVVKSRTLASERLWKDLSLMSYGGRFILIRMEGIKDDAAFKIEEVVRATKYLRPIS